MGIVYKFPAAKTPSAAIGLAKVKASLPKGISVVEPICGSLMRIARVGFPGPVRVALPGHDPVLPGFPSRAAGFPVCLLQRSREDKHGLGIGLNQLPCVPNPLHVRPYAFGDCPQNLGMRRIAVTHQTQV